MDRGEIFIARFPLGGTVGIKLRPVLLLSGPVGSVPEFLTAYITSVVPSPLLPSDLVLDPARAEDACCMLKTKSIVRLHKLATLHQRDLVRMLGQLSQHHAAEVESRLRVLLNL